MEHCGYLELEERWEDVRERGGTKYVLGFFFCHMLTLNLPTHRHCHHHIHHTPITMGTSPY